MSQGGQIYDFNNVTKFLKTHTTHKNKNTEKNLKNKKQKDTNIRCC